jgi:hypothetical protein
LGGGVAGTAAKMVEARREIPGRRMRAVDGDGARESRERSHGEAVDAYFALLYKTSTS